MTLPARVLEHLQAHGPSFTSALAEELDATTGAVSQAITSLRARCLVERAGTEPSGANPRVLYRATGEPPLSAYHAPPRTPDDDEQAPPPLLAGDLLDRMRDELRLLRFELQHSIDVEPEILELVYRNEPLPGA